MICLTFGYNTNSLQIESIHGIINCLRFLCQDNHLSPWYVIVLYHAIVVKMVAGVFDNFGFVLLVYLRSTACGCGVSCIYAENMVVGSFYLTLTSIKYTSVSEYYL